MKSVSLLNQLDRIELSTRFLRVQSMRRCAIVFAAIATISACGGGGGDSSPTPGSDSLIPGGLSGGDATDVAADELQRIAANSAGAGLGANLGNLGRLSDETQNNLATGEFAGGLVSSNNGNTETLESLDSSSSNFLNNSLGVGDPGAMTTREGNIITIDPDDQSICGDEIPLAGGFTDDLFQCQDLVSDLMVQIDARSEESGIITYLFQNTPVLLIGYSPMGASYEVRLDGWQLVSRRLTELNGVTNGEMAILSGTLRLAATVLNSEPGAEAGELSLKVTEAIRLGSTGTDAGITLQPSTVFELALNEATGNVSMGVNWGALQLIAASGDSEGNSSTTTMNLGGLSGELSFNENQPTFQVRNIGIGSVPLNITIDSVESVNLTLANFGVTINNDTGMVSLDGALNANLMLNNLAGLLEDRALDFTASAIIAAPSNTSFVQQDNGSTMLVSGGPLTATLIGGDNLISGQSEVSIDAGECFSSADDTENTNDVTSAIAKVLCN